MENEEGGGGIAQQYYYSTLPILQKANFKHPKFPNEISNLKKEII